MKKILMTILLLCCVALLCVTFVACDPSSTGTNNPSSSNEQKEAAKYTVEFKTNGDTVLANPKLYNVEYGSTVQPPKDENGNEIVPSKKGCTFQYWSENGTARFDFATPIKKNTTLTAMYTNNTYKHNVVLTAKVKYTADGQFDGVDESGRAEGYAYLEDAEKNESTTTIKSTYSEKTELACAKSIDGVENPFCFWFYLDESGKPQQFTSWVYSNEAKTQMLTKYEYAKELTLYPMFEDNLPYVDVEYLDDPKYTPNASPYRTDHYKFGKNIPIENKYTPSANVKSGYSFNNWYYEMTTLDGDGKEITTKEKFEYEVIDTQNNVNTPTIPMDAAGKGDNFSNVTLKLYASWTREIDIASPEAFISLHNQLVKKDPTDAEKLEIEDILSANIHVYDLDFGSRVVEPLFDSEHVFKGTIDGGYYEEDKENPKYCYTVSRGIFGNAEHASVFGYSDGVIKNIKFFDVVLKIAKNENDGYNNSVYMGTVTTRNGGSILNCTIEFMFSNVVGFAGLHNVVFGGVTALNMATSTTTGIVNECSVLIPSFAADCEALTFGGIAGESNASSTISDVDVSVSVFQIVCENDNNPSNGSKSSLTMGGIVGTNSGAILRSTVRLEVGNVTSLEEFVFGGVVGANIVGGNIGKTAAVTILGGSDHPAQVGGTKLQATCVGGMVGKNEGYVVNSHCNAELYVRVTQSASKGSTVYVGGIIGSNYSDKEDSLNGATVGIGAINYCYSTGAIFVETINDLDNVSVYAGGIAGRNAQGRSSKTCKVNSVFAAVGINVRNVKENCYLGNMFGVMEKDSAVGAKSYYAGENVLCLNGADYERVDGEGEEYTENFPITVVGKEAELSNLGDSEWVLTTKEHESTLGFSDDDWEIVDGKPALKAPQTVTA